jgi:hypothetical protein
MRITAIVERPVTREGRLSRILREQMILRVLAEPPNGRGFDRRFAFPHGGHLINLHIATGLGLGGCKSYPDVFVPLIAELIAGSRAGE